MGNKVIQIENQYAGQQLADSPKQQVYIDLSMESTARQANIDYTEFIKHVIKLVLNTDPEQMSGAEFKTMCDSFNNMTAQYGLQKSFDILLNNLEADADGRKNAEMLLNDFLSERQYRMNRLVNIKAIQNSLYQIFTWIQGERVLNPEFGSTLRYLLYEQLTDENENRIVSEINRCISKWEPRVEIQNVVRMTDYDDRENNTSRIQIIYHIKGLDDQLFTYEYHV